MTDLPIIDVEQLFRRGATSSVDQRIGAALAVAGGFVVTRFPGAEKLEDRAKRLLRFFDLPAETRRTVGTFPTNPNGRNVYRGFTSLLNSDEFARSEWFDIGPSEPCRKLPVRGVEVLAESNLWPDTEPYPGWRLEVDDHYADMHTTSRAIMFAVGRAQGVDADMLRRRFEGSNSTLRLLHYPAPERLSLEGDSPNLAAVRHTDGSSLSLLWQAGPGLQAEGPDGVWRDVPHLPDSISVHLGDVLEMMTDGAIKATPHRVVDHGGKRWSIGFFLEPAPTASMTGSGGLQDTYGWRLLERLRSYPSMRDLIPEPGEF